MSTVTLSELADFVLEDTGQPIDVWAVAATLESRGVRDVDARERHGTRDVFELAEAVLAECRRRPDTAPERIVTVRPGQVGRFIKLYVRGGFFFVPLLMQIAAVVLLGYGLWASMDFSSRQASIVGCALLFGFAVTGPAVQVLGYLGPRFSEAGKHTLAEHTTAVLFGVGIAGLAVGAVLWAFAAWLSHAWSARTLGAGLVYYALTGLLTLTSGVLYMLRQFIFMLLATALGIAVVGFVLHETSLGIYGAHWLGLDLVVVIELGWAIAILRRRSRGTSAELVAATPPPTALLVRASLPFAIYGFAYYGFLFTDRLFAWSAGSHSGPFAFLPSYEVGLDWALLGVTPALAYLEIAIHRFSDRLEDEGARHALTDVAGHNRSYFAFYSRGLVLLVALYALGTAVVFVGLRAASDLHSLHSVGRFFTDETTLRVFWVGALGYGLLVWALYNAGYLFMLGRPWRVLRGLLPGFVVAIVFAYTCSRVYAPWAASIGLVVGAFVFALISLSEVRRLLAELDYYSFAAF